MNLKRKVNSSPLHFVVPQRLCDFTDKNCAEGKSKTSKMDPLRYAAAQKAVADYEATLKDAEAKVYSTAKKARGAMRRKVTLAMNTVTEELAKGDDAGLNKVKNYIKSLQENSQQLEALQESMDALILDEGAAEADLQLHYYNYTVKVVDCCAEADSMIDSLSTTNTNPTPKKTSVLLPKAQLPKFSGKSCAEYMSFIDTFKAMIGSKDLGESERFTYLKLCLEGEAKTIADGYLVNDDNYKNLLRHLDEKFGQKKLIQQDYFYKLYDLPDFKWSEISSWNIKLITIVRSLESTGVDIEANAGFIVTLLQKKMPPLLLQKWNEEEAEEDDFSADRLFSFLDVKAKAIMSQEKSAKDTKPKQSSKPQNNPTSSTASMLATNTTPCPLDNSPHKLEKCPRFLNKSVPERNAFLYDHYLCRKCLTPLKDHKRECTATCEMCPQHGNYSKHHTLVHQSSYNPYKSVKTSAPYQNRNNTTKAPDRKEIKQVSTAALSSGIGITKHLPAKAFTPNGQKINVRVFIDEGSDKTFATEMVQKRGKFYSK